jgi:hypothetical protein
MEIATGGDEIELSCFDLHALQKRAKWIDSLES